MEYSKKTKRRFEEEEKERMSVCVASAVVGEGGISPDGNAGEMVQYVESESDEEVNRVSIAF